MCLCLRKFTFGLQQKMDALTNIAGGWRETSRIVCLNMLSLIFIKWQTLKYKWSYLDIAWQAGSDGCRRIMEDIDRTLLCRLYTPLKTLRNFIPISKQGLTNRSSFCLHLFMNWLNIIKSRFHSLTCEMLFVHPNVYLPIWPSYDNCTSMLIHKRYHLHVFF